MQRWCGSTTKITIVAPLGGRLPCFVRMPGWASLFTFLLALLCQRVVGWTPPTALATTRHATRLYLFYKAPPSPAAAAPLGVSSLPDEIAQDWMAGDISFPCSFPVQMTKKQNLFSNKASSNQQQQMNGRLTIRPLQWKDLDNITNMCVREYSTYSTPSLSPSFTSPPMNLKTAWNSFGQWVDQASLGPYVRLSMILKLWFEQGGDASTIPNDHVVLVASLTENIDKGDDASQPVERLVGMVEISRQPPMPERNPPAIPIPLWIKEAYSRTVQKQSTQGWITNLLIVPEYRGRGWAKVLVLACEGVARHWPVTSSIHLHCDASYRVAQKLYRSMGYQTTATSLDDYAWMSNNDKCESSIYVIDGVPLLYMSKPLD